jgi:hypothetical protein
VMYHRISAQVKLEDVEAAPISVVSGDGGPFPSVELSESFHLMPSRGTDLAAALRRLADRVDEVMACANVKAVA